MLIAAIAAALNLLQVIVLAILQGVAELFPVSSLGHTVILPALLRWNINQTDPAYLAFVVLLHLGTAAALLLFYWRDWVHLLGVLFASLARGKFSDDPDERFIWLVIVGTVPAAVLALLFQDLLRANFGNPKSAAVLLAVNGVLMLVGETLRRRQSVAGPAASGGSGAPADGPRDGPEGALRSALEGIQQGGTPATVHGAQGSGALSTAHRERESGTLAAADQLQDSGTLAAADGAQVSGILSTIQEYKDVDRLGWGGALIVGLFQSLALLPGISRSGATMVGGLALGLRHHEAMRYTFMLATPIIVAASLKTTPDLFAPAGRGILGYAVLGCLLSGVAAYLSVRFLDRYFQTNRLDPFAYYCLAAGIGAFVLLSAGL